MDQSSANEPHGLNDSSAELYDLHCHLDFAPPEAFGELLALPAPQAPRSPAVKRIAGAFSCTVTPRGYLDLSRELENATAGAAPGTAGAVQCVRVGAGLHPWWLADGGCDEPDVALLEDLVTGRFDGYPRRFVGEIGLDFAPRRAGSVDKQIRAFGRIVAACSDGGRVISIHAVRSAGMVLDILERHRAAETNACILHWFSGNSEELGRAVRMGCHFSLGTRMLATKRGRAYARAIPPEQLLLETDLPDCPGSPLDVASWQRDLAQALALLEEAAGRPLGDIVAQNSVRLLGLPV